jgi:hypothetical protein
VGEAEEVFYLCFPSGDELSEVVQPSEAAFDFPAALVASERPPFLSLLFAVDAVGRDHLNVLLAHLLVQCIGIISLVAYQPAGSSSRKHSTRTASQTWTASEALSTVTARGRPSPEAIAVILVTDI